MPPKRPPNPGRSGSLRNKLLLWFLLLSLVPLVGLGTIAFFTSQNALQRSAFAQLEALQTAKANQLESYFHEQQRDTNALVDALRALREDAFNKLDAVRTLKQSQIKTYFTERRNDLGVLVDMLETLTLKTDAEGVTPAALGEEAAQRLLVHYKETYGYDNVYLISPQGDLIYAAVREPDYQTNLLTGPYKGATLGRLVARVLESKQFEMSDMGRYPSGQYAPAVFIAQPLLNPQGQVAAVAALRLSIEGINAIMQERTGLGETGETYLVGRYAFDIDGPSDQFPEFYFRTDARLVEESTILNTAYPVYTEAVVNAMAGGAGHGVILNYRGAPVVSSWAPVGIASVQWVIVAEMGVEEAFSPRLEGIEADFFTRYSAAQGFDDLLLISPEGGYIFYSVAHNPDYRTNLLYGPYRDSNLARLVAQVLKTKQLEIADFERYAPARNAPAAFMAQPLLDDAGEIDLIVAVQLSLEEINALMQEHTGLGKTGETYLVGPDLLWRSDSRFLDQLGIDSTVLHPDMAVDTVAARSALAGETGTQIIRGYQGKRVLSSWAPLTVHAPDETHPEGLRWAVIAEIDQEEVNAPVVRLALFAAGLLAGAGILVVLATLRASRNLAAPIVQVAEAATAVAGGDLTRRVVVHTGDEIEQMATAFNQMAARIASMVGMLEQRVSDLTAAEAELQRSVQRLTALHNVGQAITTLSTLREVGQSIVHEVTATLGYPAVALLLVDQQRQEVYSVANYGNPQRPPGRRIKLGQGVLTRAVRSGQVQLVPDVTRDPDWIPGLLPDCRSEVHVPVKLRAEVTGLLIVESRELDAFSREDVSLLSLFASQAAIAIENARLYEQAQQDAETQRILLRELDHRVKNNLAAIAGLLRMEQARPHASREESLTAALTQVESIAAVHEQLSGQKHGRVGLRELAAHVVLGVCRQMAHPEQEIAVRVAGEETPVNSRQATTLALVLAELATNSLKHAFAGRPQGQISVQVSRQAGTEPGRSDSEIVLTYRDDGPGLARLGDRPERGDPRRTSGRGLGLITSLVEKLPGSLDINSQAQFSVTIRFEPEA